jgi:hypothetical protein
MPLDNNNNVFFLDIDIGSQPDDDTGDNLYEAGDKINRNFDDLYDLLVSLNLLSTSEGGFVRNLDPRLSDQRIAVHASGRHEEGFYAYRSGDRFQDFGGKNFSVTSGLLLGRDTERQHSIIGTENRGNLQLLYQNLELSYFMTTSKSKYGSALVLPETDGNSANKTLVDIVTSADHERGDWESIFRFTKSGEIYVKGKKVLDSTGVTMSDELKAILTGAPESLDSLKEIAAAITKLEEKGSTSTFLHLQTVISDTWVIRHNLDDPYAQVSAVFDHEMTLHHPSETNYIGTDVLSIRFTSPIRGRATIMKIS